MEKDIFYIWATGLFCVAMFVGGFYYEYQNVQIRLETCERIARFSNGD